FARQGARLVLAARRGQELDRVKSEIEAGGGEAAVLAGDVAEETYAAALVDLAVSRFGSLHIAFNNAGATGEMGQSHTVSLDGWRHTIDTNLTGAFLGAKHQIPAMLENGGGSIIFTSSFVGYTVGIPGMAAYAA